MGKNSLVFAFGSFVSNKRLAQFQAEAAKEVRLSSKGVVLQLVPIASDARKPNRRAKKARSDRRLRYYRGKHPKHARRA